MGCYRDSRTSRALQGTWQSTKTNTISSCQQWCFNQNYKYAGMEYGEECYCGNSIASSSSSIDGSNCQMACSGNSREMCGGRSWAISIYAVQVVNPTPPPSPSWLALGCFTESSNNRALKAMNNGMTNITVEKCQALCNSNKYRVAGLAGGVCYCDDVIAFQSKPTSGCSIKCKGNNKQNCGGTNKINLYQLLQSTSTCVKPLVRREWRQLSSDRQKQYLKGINLMKKAPSQSGHGNLYEDFVATHVENVPSAHNVAAFLPWHRWYLKQLEGELQRLLKDKSFALPYWDWTIDSQAPEKCKKTSMITLN
jgi:hypothetical protein